MTVSSTILLVEGRKPSAEHLTPVLNDQGYQVVTANTRRGALTKAQETLPKVIVLDAPSLRFDSERFCKSLQDAGLDIPILMLLPEGATISRNDGARAHLRRPFSAKKLENRIARLLPIPGDEVLQVGDIVLNLKQRCVTFNKRESSLTPKQAALLEIFMRHPGEVLSRRLLMKHVWNTDYVGDTRTLEVHIHWLRKALEDDSGTTEYLRTVRGRGYCFAVPEKKKKKKQ